MDIWVTMIAAFAGCIGFSLLFNVSKKNLLAASIGSLLTWIVYLTCKMYEIPVFFESIIASAFATCYAEILARIKKTPAITFLILALIPLIPGSSLYYMMSNMVQGNVLLARTYGRETVSFALGLAAGMSLVIAIRGIKYEAIKKRKKE